MLTYNDIESYVISGFWDEQRVKDAATKGIITQIQMIELFRNYFNSELVVEDNIHSARITKIAELSDVCCNTITDGFDLVLSDGESHHFSLTAQDQLNLITLSSMITTGETSIPYHADGELCKLYSVSDILAIINAATSFKTYNITYYNSLKVYIESLDDINTISSIYYGSPIPQEYQSEILQSLTA